MTLEELEKRVKAIEDMEEIKRLHHRYINLMDNLKYADVLDLFTDDCTSEVRNSGPKHGKKEIEDIYFKMLASKRGPVRNDGHLAIQPEIVMIDDETAHGTWLIYMLFSKPTINWVQGKNECEYKEVNGQWKIHKLKFTRTLASDPTMYP